MTRIKKFVISILAIMAMCCTLFSVTAFADGATLVNLSSLDKWSYEAFVALPEGSIEYNNDTKKASVKVIDPNGNEITDTNFTLSVEGCYVIEYSADFEGVVQTLTQNCVVRKPLYYAKTSESVKLNGTYAYAAADKSGAGYNVDNLQSTKPEEKEAETKHIQGMLTSSVQGLQVSLKKGEVFQYSKVLKLKGKTKVDDILTMIITPDTIGSYDVENFTIKLTDAFDPTNVVTVTTYAAGENSIVYTAAAATGIGQQVTGFNWNNDSKYVNDGYGTPMRFNLRGPWENSRSCQTNNDSGLSYDKATMAWTYKADSEWIKTISDNGMSLSMDYANLSLHNRKSPHSLGNQVKDGLNGRASLIVDLDDPMHFEKLWTGFSGENGECFLSIEGGTYNAETFNFVITHLMDANIKSDAWADNDRGNPPVKVASGDYGDELPGAILGREYKLFDATCLSPYYGDLDVKVEVTSPTGEPVAVTDGTITTTELGKYTIKYYALDNFKTEYFKLFEIECVEKRDDITISYVNEEEVVKAGVAGTFIGIADVIPEGGTGFKAITKLVKLGDEDVEISDDDTFFPKRAGTYTVYITATDYVGISNTISYDVEIGTGDKPVYVSDVTLPNYFISGVEYKLPELMAYDYTDGSGREIKPQIAYIDSEGVKIAVNNVIIPVADEYVNTVDVIYFTNSSTAEGNKEFRGIPIVDIETAGKLDLTKLLSSKDIDVVAGPANSTLSFSKDSSIDFINPLGANGLQIRFKGVLNKAFYEHFVITFTDIEHPDETVNFIYSPVDGDKSYFRINNFSAIPFEAAQSLSSNDTFAMTVDTYAKTVKHDLNSASTPTIETYANGKEFKGFTTGKVYVTFSFIGVSGEAELVLVSIAGQSITNRSNNAAPTVAISGAYLGFKEIGEIARIPAALVTDAIDPNVTGTVTVKTPSGSVVTSVDGKYLSKASCESDYMIKMTEYGAYQVTFEATDSMGKSESYSYYLNVMDEVAPEITVLGEEITEGVVGEAISAPLATAKDNVDEKVTVSVYLNTTSGMFYFMRDNKTTFTPDRAGLYRIVYVARDSSGNIGLHITDIVVTNA